MGGRHNRSGLGCLLGLVSVIVGGVGHGVARHGRKCDWAMKRSGSTGRRRVEKRDGYLLCVCVLGIGIGPCRQGMWKKPGGKSGQKFTGIPPDMFRRDPSDHGDDASIDLDASGFQLT